MCSKILTVLRVALKRVQMLCKTQTNFQLEQLLESTYFLTYSTFFYSLREKTASSKILHWTRLFTRAKTFLHFKGFNPCLFKNCSLPQEGISYAFNQDSRLANTLQYLHLGDAGFDRSRFIYGALSQISEDDGASRIC